LRFGEKRPVCVVCIVAAGGAKQSAAGRNHFAPERKTEETPRDYSYDNEKNFRGRL
jgi:hypothetical protein